MSQTAERAFTLLELITRSDQPRALMELSAQTGLDKTTTARLLKFLLERSMIVRDGTTKKYSVGPGLVSLAAAATSRSSLHHIAPPYLAELRDQTDETVTVHLRVRDQRICVAGVESRQLTRRVAPVGEPIPLYQGTSGRVILAFLPDNELRSLLNRAELKDASIEMIERQLGEIRETGYLVAPIGEHARDDSAVSAPIFDSEGVKASLTVAGPNKRWTKHRMEKAAPSIVAAAAEISEALGGRTKEP